MPSEKPVRRLQDIVDNIDAIERYVAGCDEQTFLATPLVLDAVERCLSRISEAAAKLGPSALELVPDQPWPSIRGLGNRLRHEYDAIDPRDIWAIATESLPALRRGCVKALRELDQLSP